MAHPYIPNIHLEKHMLEKAGIDKKSLFSDIPDNLRLRDELKIPEPRSEIETYRYIKQILKKNKSDLLCFMGGGSYPVYVPAHVKHIIQRSEFYTSYTSYQAEVSQGMLQALFEFQSMIAELYGMDCANASMYDGATALAEAILMAMRITKKKKIILPYIMHWDMKSVIYNYTEGAGGIIDYVDLDEKGLFNLDELLEKIDKNTAAVCVQNPSFVGTFQTHIKELAEISHDSDAKLIVYSDPVALGITKSPGELGADIAVGDGQSLGIPMWYGGPTVGIFTFKYNKKDIRQAPGRFVGMTVDKDGQRRFTLTLQAREQAIRRASATSNICSNEALCALNAAVYLASVGPEGLKKIAEISMKNAHYLMRKLNSLPTVFAPHYNGYHFREFTAEFQGQDLDTVIKGLIEHGILPGIKLDKLVLNRILLIATTELHSKEDLDRFIDAVGDIIE